MANYQILYGKSVAPSGLLLDACEVADALSSSGAVSKNRVFDFIYEHPRRYSVVGGTNFIWLSIEAIEPLITEVRASIKDAASRSKYDEATKRLRGLCSELMDYKQMRSAEISGVFQDYNRTR